MNFKKLSIIIPAYNESGTILKILEKVMEVELTNGIEKEIIVIDDRSKDDTLAKVKDFQSKQTGCNLQIIEHERNQGKGAAIHSGIREANGDYLIIQDADL